MGNIRNWELKSERRQKQNDSDEVTEREMRDENESFFFFTVILSAVTGGERGSREIVTALQKKRERESMRTKGPVADRSRLEKINKKLSRRK